ncbi:D-alanyl-D-alanine carboxypeptidase [[Ruminococcus] lactaris]|uniref:D-alanyl-D-alanine carboxypeptidase family protein n=1 Tax=[Ruminococcus] lactaris TaxID=46228 RepID=UPI001D0451E6|nr:D-alanyl-D-alanine carboxypeptidase family protein [[Ruminococcus] lactaris]MCB5813109.1 D-alanyl-D-alanine carboxypeptidase [[Ruminococcus] lactaris]MCB5820472.1 D-alanyl-D-alanine carboxypeptidase [[Ruminococcus] lactaris]MCB5834620.1 D-alanyl-D-alanine carboxypeptidase [[Ruminococcus] lactaris]MCB5849558.1 D-alanyl-D-alanine carboxypeptidase [[Ruminococcus] lactaris]
MKTIKKLLAVMLICIQTLQFSMVPNVLAEETTTTPGTEQTSDTAVEVTAPSAILMEMTTGTVLYEKDADTARPPASVTKVMTMLLIFDALAEGKIQLEDEVTTSEYASSMGGSQVFLETGEKQTVETLLKCISVASANDACVAMAEYISGNEEEFVRQMNLRAEGLGMKHTHFVNCNGLDAEGHETSARDIALMSRELLLKYPEIHNYCTIWMENITHTTSKGSSEFGLTNTNKLIRQYEYSTGLKTGSTGKAKFCVSATAEKNGVSLIAVIMGAEDSKARFKDAVTLLNYGFGKCQIYTDEKMPSLDPISVTGGIQESISLEYEKKFTYLDTTGANLNAVTSRLQIPDKVNAPVKKGDTVGQRIYYLDEKEIGSVNLLAEETVKKSGFFDYLRKALYWIAL